LNRPKSAQNQGLLKFPMKWAFFDRSLKKLRIWEKKLRIWEKKLRIWEKKLKIWERFSEYIS